MRSRRLKMGVLLLGIWTLLGCRPVTDGFSEGVTDGLSASTSTFIEELATALVGSFFPDEGA